MALLKSVNNVPGIDYYEYRDNQFYNKYNYRMRVKIPCVKYTWYCKKPDDLDNKISGKFSRYGNVRKEDLQEVKDNLQALKAVVELQHSRKKDSMGMRIEGETVAFFHNDLNALKGLESKIGNIYTYDYTEVQTASFSGTKYFVNEPTHKYRVYLKSKRVPDGFRDQLRAMFQNHPSLFPSNSLKYWLNSPSQYTWKFRWSSASHFIDYDDESTLSYLALIHGEMLGKKYKLEKRPDPV